MRTLTASRRHKVASFVLMLTRSRISDADADVRQVEFVFFGGLFRRQRPGFFDQVVFRWGEALTTADGRNLVRGEVNRSKRAAEWAVAPTEVADLSDL